MTTGTSDRPSERDEARGIVAEVLNELNAAHQAYGVVYHQVETAAKLDAGTRESATHVIASVATALRRLAPSLAATHVLPEEEHPDVALVLLRILTDSLSVALGDNPNADLMVRPGDADELFREIQAIRPEEEGDA